MPSPPTLFTAIVLAGDRGPQDPVATAAKVSCKAFTPIDNKPMILRVLETLAAAKSIGASMLSGPKKEHLQKVPAIQDTSPLNTYNGHHPKRLQAQVPILSYNLFPPANRLFSRLPTIHYYPQPW